MSVFINKINYRISYFYKENTRAFFAVIAFFLLLLFLFLAIFLVSYFSEIAPVEDVRANARSHNSIHLTWIDDEHSEKYEIYRSLSLRDGYEKIGSTEERHYLDEELTPQTEYYYRVKKILGEEKSELSKAAQATTEEMGPVQNFTLEKLGSSYLSFSWDDIREAERYNIYRTQDVTRPYSKIDSTTNNHYLDTQLESGVAYYYVVTYVVNGEESDYSRQIKADTDHYWSCGYSISYEGKLYDTVSIGEECFFAENFNHDVGEGSWCYNEDEDNCKEYGRLYTFEAINQGICPDGWRVPSDDDFKILEQNIGMPTSEVDSHGWRGAESNLGDRIKTSLKCSQKGEPFCGDIGFNVLTGGSKDERGNFLHLGTRSFLWTSSLERDFAWARGFGDNRSGIYRSLENKKKGFYLRCIKD